MYSRVCAPASLRLPLPPLQQLLKDSIQVLKDKCDTLIAHVEDYEAGVDFDEAMP